MSSKVVDLGTYRWLRSMSRMYGEDIARQFAEVLRDIERLQRGTFADPAVPSMLRPVGRIAAPTPIPGKP